MYLVDEQHIVGLQRSQDAGQVARLVEHGAARNLKSHPQLVGNDLTEGCLAQSGRSVQQRMVERLATILGCLYKHTQIVHHRALAAEVVEAQRPERILKLLFGRRQLLLSYIKIFRHRA